MDCESRLIAVETAGNIPLLSNQTAKTSDIRAESPRVYDFSKRNLIHPNRLRPVDLWH